MFGDFFDIRVAANASASADGAASENRARLAFSTHSFQVKGVGSVRVGKVKFDTIFLGRPLVMCGASLLDAPDVKVWSMPQVAGLVTKWVVDKKGHYTGAEIYAVTDLRRKDGETPEEYPKVTSVLDVVFMGTAYKDVGAGVLATASTITARASGMGG